MKTENCDEIEEMLLEEMIDRIDISKMHEAKDLVDCMIEDMRNVIAGIKNQNTLPEKVKEEIISVWNKRIKEFLDYHFEVSENGIYFAYEKYSEYGLEMKAGSKTAKVFESIDEFLRDLQYIEEMIDMYMDIIRQIDEEFEIELSAIGYVVDVHLNLPATKENIEKYSKLGIEPKYPNYEGYMENIYETSKYCYGKDEPLNIVIRLSNEVCRSVPLQDGAVTHKFAIKSPCICYMFIECSIPEF